MPVLVTAFGPFDGRKQNASSLALLDLKKILPEIRFRIFPVDSVLAPARMKQAIRQIRPSAIVMLGEAAGCTGIRLETTAWNMRDFNIPDIAGRKPLATPVRPGSADSLKSTLPLSKIHRRLESLGHNVSLSDDPGRYLCNQLFFTALNFLAENSLEVPAGFIHLPLNRDYASSESANALAEAIRLILPARKKPRWAAKRLDM